MAKPSEEKKGTTERNIEKKIVELAKKGMTTEKIGCELRKEGVYVKSLLKKRIGKILKEHGIESNADKKFIEKRIERLNAHLSANKHDYSAKRALFIKVAQNNKLK